MAQSVLLLIEDGRIFARLGSLQAEVVDPELIKSMKAALAEHALGLVVQHEQHERYMAQCGPGVVGVPPLEGGLAPASQVMAERAYQSEAKYFKGY